MFDKMIVSNTSGAEQKGRTRYFLMSGLTVGFLFIFAVVASLYAADIALGAEEFELSVMMAPVVPDTPPPPDPVDKNEAAPAKRSEVAVRNQNIQRLDELPNRLPDSISVVKSKFKERPYGKFFISSGIETDASHVGPGTGGRRNGGDTEGSSSNDMKLPEPIAEKIPEPPVRKVTPPVSKTPISIGVVNGKAIHLPKPPYPQSAIAVQVQGEVTVQVTIDETGKVISAKAAKGHPLLKPGAEQAARNARFSPTLLSNVPVKVTGVIVYNFKRN